MLKIAFILTMILYISLPLSSLADTTFSTVEFPGLSNNNPYLTASQPITSYCSPPNQYYQNPYYYQHSYLNPIQPQYQNVYPYGYNNYNQPLIPGVPYSVSSSNIAGFDNSGNKNQIIKNIGQNILYSLLRGY